jgi:hypothetical protein
MATFGEIAQNVLSITLSEAQPPAVYACTYPGESESMFCEVPTDSPRVVRYNSRDPEDVSGTNEMVGVFNTVRGEPHIHCASVNNDPCSRIGRSCDPAGAQMQTIQS